MFIIPYLLLTAVPWDDRDSALVPCKTNKGEKPKSNLSFEWTYNSSPVLENAEKKNRVSVTGDGELLINGFSSKDHGKYTCRVKDKKTLIEENSIDVDDKCNETCSIIYNYEIYLAQSDYYLVNSSLYL